MTSKRVTASEFQKEYGRYASLARRQVVTITNHGRDELVIMRADEYERLRRLDNSRPPERSEPEEVAVQNQTSNRASTNGKARPSTSAPAKNTRDSSKQRRANSKPPRVN